jgi:hypothetical protein
MVIAENFPHSFGRIERGNWQQEAQNVQAYGQNINSSKIQKAVELLNAANPQDFLFFDQVTRHFYSEETKHIDLSHAYINGQALKNIFERSPKVENLDLSNFTFNGSVEAFEGAFMLHELKVLNFAGSAFSGSGISGAPIRDRVLKAILDRCPNLESLDLSFCGNLSLDTLSKLPKLESLKILNFSGLKNANSLLISLMQKCPALETISLSKTDLTSLELENFSRNYPNITVIY